MVAATEAQIMRQLHEGRTNVCVSTYIRDTQKMLTEDKKKGRKERRERGEASRATALHMSRRPEKRLEGRAWVS